MRKEFLDNFGTFTPPYEDAQGNKLASVEVFDPAAATVPGAIEALKRSARGSRGKSETGLPSSREGPLLAAFYM